MRRSRAFPSVPSSSGVIRESSREGDAGTHPVTGRSSQDDVGRLPGAQVPVGPVAADERHVTRQELSQGSPRSPHWFDPAHQADIAAALDSHLAAGVPERGPFTPRPERVRELAELATASTLPARAALLRWGALPASVRSHLLTSWYGIAVRRHSAA